MTCILLRKCIPLSKLEKWSADVDSPIFLLGDLRSIGCMTSSPVALFFPAI